MTQIDHTVWQSQSVVAHYFERKDSRPFLSEQIEIMVKLASALCRPVQRFMDLGCGDGILAAAIMNRFRGATAVLADHSEPMLEAAREKLQHLGSVDFRTIDYSTSTWVERVTLFAPLDLVVSGYSIHHQPDARKSGLYAEIFDLLSPGGMFINIEHVASPTERLASLWDGIRVDSLYDAELARGISTTRAAVEKEYLERPERAANLFAPVETQCQWLREIGYTDVDCYFKYFELAIFGGCRP